MLHSKFTINHNTRGKAMIRVTITSEKGVDYIDTDTLKSAMYILEDIIPNFSLQTDTRCNINICNIVDTSM